jgi:hypothetical protein
MTKINKQITIKHSINSLLTRFLFTRCFNMVGRRRQCYRRWSDLRLFILSSECASVCEKPNKQTTLHTHPQRMKGWKGNEKILFHHTPTAVSNDLLKVLSIFSPSFPLLCHSSFPFYFIALGTRNNVTKTKTKEEKDDNSEAFHSLILSIFV